MIDPGGLLNERPFTPEGNYLVGLALLKAFSHANKNVAAQIENVGDSAIVNYVHMNTTQIQVGPT